ncbi:DUF3053 family protein, partial [Klebsiella pneumoniae]|uniref:DUF3053 family protein n=1 Tax=Klebsiella pneumoniae TaxID=573 RepID=UPI0039C1D9B0
LRNAFIELLQMMALRSGDRLQTLTAYEKIQFGPFVSDYAVIFGYSQQVCQAMDAGLRPVVDGVPGSRVRRDSMSRGVALR